MNINTIEKHAQIKEELENFEDDIIMRIQLILNTCSRSYQKRYESTYINNDEGIKVFNSNDFEKLISYNKDFIEFSISEYMGCGDWETTEHLIPTSTILGDDYNEWSKEFLNKESKYRKTL